MAVKKTDKKEMRLDKFLVEMGVLTRSQSREAAK